MADDIVTRLRGELVVRLNGEPWVTFDALPVLGEAADEIERLRNLVKQIAQYCDEAVDRASQCLGSPHSMWGAINALSRMSDVAEQALNGNWDYDPYEGIE